MVIIIMNQQNLKQECDLIEKEQRCQTKLQQRQNQMPNQKEEFEQDDDIDHYADDTPLPKSKPFDLKHSWLGETNNVLEKFNSIYDKLKIQQRGIQQGFKMFAENQHNYKLSSLRKININLDRKHLYNQYMLKTRQPIEKISPTLMINIISYTDEHLFFNLFRVRKVSRIFNEIFLNQSIQMYMADKDYLYSGHASQALKSSINMCKKYIAFHKTFLYYKAMQYTEQIPQNSIMKDFEEAVNFINEIHRLVMERNNRSFTYYQMMNNFMKRHRVVIGLSSLSLTSLVMVRKAAIIAFSNYLAFNRQQRTKQQITKTKYSKVINVVEYQDYRDSLILNTKVSTYLYENFNFNFAVLVSNNLKQKFETIKVKSWNILIYHKHDQQKAIFLEDVELQEGKFSSARLDLQFKQDMSYCKFSTVQYLNWVLMEGQSKFLDILHSTPSQIQSLETNYQDKQQFSYCYLFRFQQYYVIILPKRFE